MESFGHQRLEERLHFSFVGALAEQVHIVVNAALILKVAD